MAAQDATQLQPVYLIWGSEDFLLDEAVGRLKSRIAKSGDVEMDMDVFDGASVRGDDVVSRANTIPFMSERRLVIVENIEKMAADGQAFIAEYVADPAPFTTLVLVSPKPDKRTKLYKALDAAKAVSEYKAPGRGRYGPVVVRMFEHAGKRIGVDAATTLVEGVGEDLRRLTIEVQKAIAYVGDAQTVTRDDIEQVMSLTATTSVWDYVDSFGARDLPATMRKLADLVSEGEAVLGVWAMTVRHVRQLLVTRALLDRGERTGAIMSELGMGDWQARKLEGQARHWTAAELERALRMAAKTEAEMKTSRDARLVFERWLALNCVKR